MNEAHAATRVIVRETGKSRQGGLATAGAELFATIDSADALARLVGGYPVLKYQVLA